MPDSSSPFHNIYAFLGENEPSLNEQQRHEVRRHFEMTRSHLYEYGILGRENNYEFHMFPAKNIAVRRTTRPLMPMMIALVPPDVYPSERYQMRAVPAPADIEILLIETRGKRGHAMVGTAVAGTQVNAKLARPGDIQSNTILTREYIADDRGGQNYLTSLYDRYNAFRKGSRQAGKDLEDFNTEIVKGRAEIRDDMVADPNILRARNPNDNEGYIRAQVLAMQKLPPLIMYINPSQFSIAYQHVISDGDRSRDGFIVEHWGLQQPVITASGNIGGTYIHGPNKTGGVTRMFQKDAASYQYFMNLFRIYRNNAYIYNVHNKISMLGQVKIFWDGAIYTGSFDSFSINESEDKPFDLTYDFQFTVRFEERVENS